MKVLLLAGTAEARALAGLLAYEAGVRVVASLAGVTQAPEALGVETRLGGFGGEVAQEDYIKINAFDAIIDATHPFADVIGPRTAAIAARLGLPCLRLLRPGWAPGPGEVWHPVETLAAAASVIPGGVTVFAATGRGSLAALAPLAEGRRLVVRVRDATPAPFPYPGGRFVVGAPGAAAAEAEFLREIGADWLLCKNAGGAAGRGKLEAARALGLPVAMVARPPLARGVETVATPEAARDWLLGRG